MSTHNGEEQQGGARAYPLSLSCSLGTNSATGHSASAPIFTRDTPPSSTAFQTSATCHPRPIRASPRASRVSPHAR